MADVKHQHWFETLKVLLLYLQPCSRNVQLILSSFTMGCILYMFCTFSNNSDFSFQINCCLTPSHPSPQFSCKSLHVRKVCCQTQLLNLLFVRKCWSQCDNFLWSVCSNITARQSEYLWGPLTLGLLCRILEFVHLFCKSLLTISLPQYPYLQLQPWFTSFCVLLSGYSLSLPQFSLAVLLLARYLLAPPFSDRDR